jgi:hypothetical protein
MGAHVQATAVKKTINCGGYGLVTVGLSCGMPEA